MILQQLKLAAAVVALAIGCGFAGFAIEQRLHEPRTVVEVHQNEPRAERPPATVRRKPAEIRKQGTPAAHRHHHTPHRSAEDDGADALNRGQL